MRPSVDGLFCCENSIPTKIFDLTYRFNQKAKLVIFIIFMSYFYLGIDIYVLAV